MALSPPTKTIGFILWHRLATFFFFGSDLSLHWVIHGAIFKGLFDSWLKEGYFLETKSKRDWHRFGSLPSFFCKHLFFFKKSSEFSVACTHVELSIFMAWNMETQGTEDFFKLSPHLTPSLCPWPGWLCLQCPISVPVPSVTGSFSAHSQGRGHCCTLCYCHLLCRPGLWLWKHSQENWFLCHWLRAVSGTRKCFSTELSEFQSAERGLRFGNSWTNSK